MTKRREFTKAVRVEIIRRSTRDGQTYCEACRAPATRFEIHHLDQDAMQIDKSRKLTAKDGQLLCIPCHKDESSAQAPVLAKVRAVEARHLGASRPKAKIKSRNDLRTRVAKEPKPALTRKELYR